METQRSTPIGRSLEPPKPSFINTAGRFLLGLLLIILMGFFLISGFLFLRDSTLPNSVIAIIAIVWGVAGAGLLFWVFTWIAEQFSETWTARVQPFVFVGPAIFLLAWYLAIPAIRTFNISLYDRDGTTFIGLANYAAVFTDRLMLEAFRNNLLWIVFGTSLSVIFGLLIAVLADRSMGERTAKSFIFLPMAISFVGAGVIWKFVYYLESGAGPQIGVLNAIVTALGGEPVAWLTNRYWIVNNISLWIVGIWLWAGFCMTVLSAALKAVPVEIIEASRVDGAGEWRIFWRVSFPIILPTVTVVTTTMIINVLKVFDIVFVMTNGLNGTEVIANRMFKFIVTNQGRSMAIAVLLILLTIPIMIYNVRRFREQEMMR